MLSEFDIQTDWGAKKIIVLWGELGDLPESVDLLVCSAFWRDYVATKSSLIGSLWWDYGISVAELSQNTALEFKDLGVWISQSLKHPLFDRIACVEMMHHYGGGKDIDQNDLRDLYDTLFFSIKKCSQRGIPVQNVAMHMLGTGNQGIPLETSLIPLLTESISALKSIQGLKSITLFERNEIKYEAIVNVIRSRTSGMGAHMAFISYSHKDSVIANYIANGLEANGIKPWIDHKMIRNSDYADDIVKGISDSKAFLVLVSENSMKSSDVLREVRNASTYSDRNLLTIWPILLQKVAYPNNFAYYLAGLDYIDISVPPIEEKAIDLCDTIQKKLNSI